MTPVLTPQQWLEIAAGASCNICGSGDIAMPPSDPPVEDVGTLRESLICPECGAISRDRGLIVGLAAVLGEGRPLRGWPTRPELRMFETSGYRGHPRYLPELVGYWNLPYAAPPDSGSREPIDARRGADLLDMQFPDGYFDIVMSAEVLEHVPDAGQAISEIVRVLAPGGHLVLQVPYVHAWERNEIRVNRWHDRDVYLATPEYHAEETLVYRIYGRELLGDLSAAGLSVAYLELDIPELAVSPQSVILATKGPYLDLSGLRVA
jgi:SAM-dependent methyltransferase